MNTPVVLLLIVGFVSMLVGAVHTAYQMFKIVSLDAESRGLKHPKLWAFLSTSGNNSSGLMMYFLARRKHPVQNRSKEVQQDMDARKKRAGVGLVFVALGAIVFVVGVTLLQGGQIL